MAMLNMNSRFDAVCKSVYSMDSSVLIPRFNKLIKEFEKTFNDQPLDYFSSPGRIEIVGNHTDHNSGKVLCAAINFDTLAAVKITYDNIIEIKSNGYPLLKVDVNDVSFVASELGTSLALIKGVVDYFVRSNKKVGGFSATMTSTVPRGAGVSSSSSFECLIAEILNVYYNNSEIDPIFIAKASQYSEKIYFGKPCGLMDQCAIALGAVNKIDFKDQENPIVETIDWNFEDLDIYVIATGGDHCDLTDDYAAIPKEMKEVAALFDAKFLREVSEDDFYKKEDSIKNKVSKRALLRAEHFFEENHRVEEAAKTIKENNMELFLKLVSESGDSSRNKLQNTYSPKGKNKNIELALDKAEKIDGVLARRVHGGGFAGTILLFVDKKKTEVENKLIDNFGTENVFKLSIRNIGSTKLDLE